MLSNLSIKYFKLAVNASSYKEHFNDISCKCPICGDSKVKKNSKRLHLYTKGTVELINCFNSGCPCENKTIYSFLKEFYPSLLPQYKREKFNSKIRELKIPSTLTESTSISWEKSEIADKIESPSNISDTSANIEKPNNLRLFDLLEFFEPLSSEIENYLKNRGIIPHFNNHKWYKAKTNIKIGEIVYNIKDHLIIPLYYKDKMYGFYSRSITEKRFITFIGTLGYKVWNWFDIDTDKPVYIFEAIFDAISSGLNNIIANLGAKLPTERLKELKDPVFCLDNDTTGIKNSIKYLEKGYKVFIMPSKYKEKDINELKLNNPNLDISELIKNNIFEGISGITRLKLKL